MLPLLLAQLLRMHLLLPAMPPAPQPTQLPLLRMPPLPLLLPTLLLRLLPKLRSRNSASGGSTPPVDCAGRLNAARRLGCTGRLCRPVTLEVEGISAMDKPGGFCDKAFNQL